MSIVTKQGDAGKTRLCSGEEVPKNDSRLDTYGTLDELASFLGLARSLCKDKNVSGNLLKKQEILFRLGTELATKDTSKIKASTIDKKDVREIDNLIFDYESKIKSPRHFIIPGSNTSSAALDVARTVCRRLERHMVSFSETGEWKNKEALIFINRLSDLLFLMARKVEG